MTPNSDYTYLGLLAVSILVVGLAFVVIHWPKDRHATFSQHVAVRTQSIIYYVALFAIVLPLLTLFFINWFVPTFQVSPWFTILVIASSTAQIACTLIPETGGWRSQYHRALAGISGLLLLPALALLLMSSVLDTTDKILVSVGLSSMVMVLLTVIAKKGMPRNFLLLQAGYFSAFFIPVLYIAYL